MGNEYERYWCKKTKRLTYRHRQVMENWLGRPLQTSEQVHHRNENKRDNRIENLQLLTIFEHSQLPRRCKINWSNYNVPKPIPREKSGRKKLLNPFCMIDECVRKATGRNLCKKHYASFHRHMITVSHVAI